MRLTALPDKIIPQGGHTLIVMRDGETRQTVCVQCERIDIMNGRRDLRAIERLASRKTERGQLAFDGRVWISASELRRQ